MFCEKSARSVERKSFWTRIDLSSPNVRQILKIKQTYPGIGTHNSLLEMLSLVDIRHTSAFLSGCPVSDFLLNTNLFKRSKQIHKNEWFLRRKVNHIHIRYLHSRLSYYDSSHPVGKIPPRQRQSVCKCLL